MQKMKFNMELSIQSLQSLPWLAEGVIDKPVDRAQLSFISAFIISCQAITLPRVETACIIIMVCISVLAI